jgi:hypothetical protein
MDFPRLRDTIVGAALAATAGIALAQAPVDLSGKWTLDTYLSDNPEQVAAAIRGDVGQVAGGMFGDQDIFGGSGRGGGRRGGEGRGGANAPPRQPNADDQKRLDEVNATLRYPPTSLSIVESADVVTVTDQQGAARTLSPTGKREKQTVGSLTLDVTTRWEGPQLVSEQDVGAGHMVRYTYSIVPTTKQLMVRIAIDRSPGRPGPFEIRMVYNRAG